MFFVFQLFFNFLVLFGIYSLISLGLVLIYKVTRGFNFAHASVMFAGAYFYYFLSQFLNLNLFWSCLFTCVFAVLMSFVLYNVFMRAFLNNDIVIFLSTLIFSLFIETLICVFFGYEVRVLDSSKLGVLSGVLNFWNVSFSLFDVLIVVFSFVVVGGFLLLYKKTNCGRVIDSVSNNRYAVRVLGVSINMVNQMVVSFAVFVVVIAGVFVGYNGVLIPFLGVNYIFKAFFAMIVGGIERIEGVIFGSFFVAFLEIIFVGFFDFKSGIVDICLYSLMILVLLFRPEGVVFFKRRSF